MATAVAELERPARVKPTFKATDKQREANRLIFNGCPNTLLYGGSRSGKTLIEVRALTKRALRAPGSRQAIWRQHFNHAKASIGRDTFPKMMRLCYPQMAHIQFSNEGIAEFPNGSELWLAGLDDKDRVEKILGQEFAGNLFNEISKLSYHAIEIGLSRLAQSVLVTLDAHMEPLPKDEQFQLPLISLYDMNPIGKRHWSHQLFVQKMKPGTIEPVTNSEDYQYLQMNPDDNRENLPPQYFNTLEGMSAAKRKRFMEGEWANDVEGALWTNDMLTACRVSSRAYRTRLDFELAHEPLSRVVIGVDPSGAGEENEHDEGSISNDIGIVVCGLGMRSGWGYVLEDGTVNGSPGVWGKQVADLYIKWGGDRVVAEKNFGGAMVEFVLRTASSTLPVTMVTSSRGKALRAEPVSALYEANQETVKHAGFFGELEDQMAAMLPQPAGYTGEGSPDRLDAAVFALTDLMLGSTYTLDNLD
jgi:hypothetical protein